MTKISVKKLVHAIHLAEFEIYNTCNGQKDANRLKSIATGTKDSSKSTPST